MLDASDKAAAAPAAAEADAAAGLALLAGGPGPEIGDVLSFNEACAALALS